MNAIVEAVCSHISKGRNIVGIDVDINGRAVEIYLEDGTVHKHTALAKSQGMFILRLNHAQRLFPKLHWHSHDEAIPDWLANRMAAKRIYHD